MLKTRTLRKIAAILFSCFLQVGFVLASMTLCATGLMSRHRDQSLDSFLIFIISIVVSSLILERASSDRFWKSYLFAVFSTVLPTTLYLVLGAIVFGTVGYFWLALWVLTFFHIGSAVVSLPFVGLFYWARSADLNTYPRRRRLDGQYEVN